MMSVLRILGMAVATAALAVAAIVVASFDRGGRRSSSIVALWARVLVAMAGVRVEVEGREHLIEEGGALYVSSHQSMLDIPVLFRVVPSTTRFVAKEALFRVPLFGWAIRLLGFIPIDRSDRRGALRSLDQAGDRALSDHPILVFPEGTRSPTGDLLPFKRGAFALAERLRLPVVPIACLEGARRMPPHSLRIEPGRMLVRVGRPLRPDHGQPWDRASLMSAVRDEIERLARSGG